jgi:hypothetical protein
MPPNHSTEERSKSSVASQKRRRGILFGASFTELKSREFIVLSSDLRITYKFVYILRDSFRRDIYFLRLASRVSTSYQM